MHTHTHTHIHTYTRTHTHTHITLLHYSHLADALIQSDVQLSANQNKGQVR